MLKHFVLWVYLALTVLSRVVGGPGTDLPPLPPPGNCTATLCNN